MQTDAKNGTFTRIQHEKRKRDFFLTHSYERQILLTVPLHICIHIRSVRTISLVIKIKHHAAR